MKAYRLKGDNASLKQALHENFSIPDISDALKLLWNHSRSELEALNFTYHEKRGSEKNPLADLIIKDLFYVFNKLDSSDKIPPIFCEAVDLLKLPPFVTNLPAATVHESNLRIKDLQTNIKVSNNQVSDVQVSLNSLSSMLSSQSSRWSEFKVHLDSHVQGIANSLNERLSSTMVFSPLKYHLLKVRFLPWN